MQSTTSVGRNILIAATLAGAWLAGGCATQGGSSPSGADANMQAFNQYVDGWRQRDPNAISAKFTPSGTYTAPGVGENLTQEQLMGYTSALFTAIPDFTIQKVQPYMIDSDTLAEEWVVSGTWTQPWPAGPMKGVPPTGKSFTLPGAAFIDFKDGKISSVVQYYDSMSLMQQLGVIQSK